jgi:hypothetical protein
MAEYLALPVLLNLFSNLIWNYLPTERNLDLWLSVGIVIPSIALWHYCRKSALPLRAVGSVQKGHSNCGGSKSSDLDNMVSVHLRRLIGARTQHELRVVIRDVEQLLEVHPTNSELRALYRDAIRAFTRMELPGTSAPRTTTSRDEGLSGMNPFTFVIWPILFVMMKVVPSVIRLFCRGFAILFHDVPASILSLLRQRERRPYVLYSSVLLLCAIIWLAR